MDMSLKDRLLLSISREDNTTSRSLASQFASAASSIAVQRHGGLPPIKMSREIYSGWDKSSHIQRPPPGTISLLSCPPQPPPPPPKGEKWKPIKPPVRLPELIERRETLMMRLRNFAVKAHRAYQDGVVLPDGPAFDASDPLAHKAMVYGLRPGTGNPAAKPQVLSLDPRPPSPRAQTPRSSSSARGSSPRQRKQQPPSSAPGALAMQSSLEGARRTFARMLADLIVSSIELIEVVSPPAYVAPPTKKQLMAQRAAAEAAAAKAAEADNDEDADDDAHWKPTERDDGVAKQYRCLADHWIAWALLPPDRAAAGCPHPPAGIRTGANYLLQLLIDYNRLPLPCASDPLLVRWFDSEEHPHLIPSALHDEEMMVRLLKAEHAIRSMLSPSQMRELYRMERSPVGRSDEAWRACSFMIYGDTGGFTERQRDMWIRDQAAIRMQVWLTRGRVTIRIKERARIRREEAARTIQKFYRGRHEGLFGKASKLSNLSIEARREAQRQRRLQEQKELEELRAQRAREARELLLARRRRAIRSAMPGARKFFKAHRSVADAWRTSLAKKFLRTVRMEKATGKVESSPETNAAARVWQARYRSWAVRGTLLEKQASLCMASGAASSIEDRRASLYAALPQLKADATTRLNNANARAAGAKEATDDAKLALRRQLLKCVGRHTLLKACVGAPLDVEAISNAINAVAPRLSQPGEVVADDAEVEGLSAIVRAAGGLNGAYAAASSKLAELESATKRQRSIRERIVKLNAAAARAKELLSAHDSGAELLLGMHEHLTTAADKWASQTRESEMHVEQLDAVWEPLERVAAAERYATELRREIELAVDNEKPASPASQRPPTEEAPSEPTSPQAAARRNSVSRSGRRASAGSIFALSAADFTGTALSSAKFDSLLADAKLAEESARKALEVASGGVRADWEDGVTTAAEASGELALVSALNGAQSVWDAHRHAIRLRNLHATRLTSVGAKLKQRKSSQQVSEAQGAKYALRKLIDTYEEARRTARAFVARSVLRDHLLVAEGRLADAKKNLTWEMDAKRQHAKQERAQKRSQELRRGSSSGGSTKKVAAGGGGMGALAQARAALERDKADEKPAAASTAALVAVQKAPPPAAEDGGSSEAIRERFAALYAARGEVAAIKKLHSLLPPPSERMPGDWLATKSQELVEEFQAMEDDAQKDEVKLGKQLKSREDAKEALRAASRTQLKKAVKKVGMALKAAGGSKGLLNALAAAKDGGGEGGGDEGGGGAAAAPPPAATIAETIEAYERSALPNCLEAERLWEQRHVLTCLCKAAADSHAARGQGPADPSLHSSWGLVQAAVYLKPPAWVEGAPGGAITSGQLLAAAKVLELNVGKDGEDWPLAWLALEYLRAPLPDGWKDVPPTNADGLPTFWYDGKTPQFEHPLVEALKEEVDIMRRRLKLRWRMYRPLECVWLVASTAQEWDNGKGPSGVFVNLATGKRTNAFPAELLAPLHPPKESNKAVMVSSAGGIMAVIKAKQEEERLAQEEARKQKRREALKESAKAAAEATKFVRRDALRSKPRCGVELMHAARALQIDLIHQPELSFLSELALCVKLPAGWSIVPPPASGGPQKYRNAVSGVVTASHPIEGFAAGFRV